MKQKSIYITSTQTFAGKSALCTALLRRYKAKGLNVGYMKPLSSTPTFMEKQVVDEDTLFIREQLELPDPLDLMAPVLLTDQKIKSILAGPGGEEDATKIKTGFEQLSREKDLVLLEGGGSLKEGWLLGLAPPQISALLHVMELVIVPYESDLQVVDDTLTAYRHLGDAMLGTVINRVPGHKLGYIQELVAPFIEKRGIQVFAILPRQRILYAASVEEIQEGLGGEVICAHDHLNELVEHLMVGAMGVESALTYFRRKANKAVITGGDRPDIQIAALETSTKCLILTGNLKPNPLIIGKAEEAGVPIIITKYDTMTAVDIIESFFGKTRFHQERKITQFETLLEESMDFERLERAISP